MKAALPLLAAAVLAVAPAHSQGSTEPPERIVRVTVYGSDPCPRGSGEEIVVCARRPNSERYRIPEELRPGSTSPENESWAERARSLEYVGRTGIQSCSTVGPGGFTGCWEQMMRLAREERRRAAAEPGQ
jgi:hypothetical protein